MVKGLNSVTWYKVFPILALVIGICVGTSWALFQYHGTKPHVTQREFDMLLDEVKGIHEKVDALWRNDGSPPTVKKEDE